MDHQKWGTWHYRFYASWRVFTVWIFSEISWKNYHKKNYKLSTTTSIPLNHSNSSMKNVTWILKNSTFLVKNKKFKNQLSIQTIIKLRNKKFNKTIIKYLKAALNEEMILNPQLKTLGIWLTRLSFKSLLMLFKWSFLKLLRIKCQWWDSHQYLSWKPFWP